jgi:Uma2 family endonuclease
MPETLTMPPPVGERPQRMWTTADWERLDIAEESGVRYEVMNGVLHMTTAPTNFHQWIVGMLAELVGVPLRKLRRGVWFMAPVGVVIPPAIAVQPDFLVVLNRNMAIVRGGRVRGAPDLVVEVRSPGNTPAQMEEKQRIYAAIGVPEYAVVEPAERALTYYRLSADGTYPDARRFGEGDTLTLTCLPDIPLVIAELFADAPDTTLDVE